MTGVVPGRHAVRSKGKKEASAYRKKAARKANDRPEAAGVRLSAILGALDLVKIERAIRPHYTKWKRGDGVSGRPPVNPVALVILLLMAVARSWSRKDTISFLRKHKEWVRFLDLEGVPDETIWSKLLGRIPQSTLDALFADLVKDLVKGGVMKLLVTAADGSFLPACSWDKEAVWGYVRRADKRAHPRGCFIENDEGKLMGFGYRVHVVVDADAELPIAVHMMGANLPDVTQFATLFGIVESTVGWNNAGWFTADKGYDAGSVRTAFTNRTTQVVIPAANTPRDLKAGGFRGPRARVYKKRTGVERFFSLLKRYLSFDRWGITGLARVRKWTTLAAIASLLIHVTNRALGQSAHSVEQFRRAIS